MKPSSQQTTKWRRNLLCAFFSAIAVFGGLALVATANPAYAHDDDDDNGDRHHGDNQFTIDVLSSKPYLVTGGDALVRVTVKKKGVSLGSVRIELNGQNVTSAFRANAAAGTLTGLVSGLRNGENELSVDAKGKGHGRADADITLTNYPIEGPVISGPHEFPFACTTATFIPFPGSPALGAPLDSDCSVERRVQYVYRTTGGQFKSLPQPFSSLPDLANTSTGVPYIVRLETGTINRAIYQTAILHNPNDAAASPFAPPAGWNKRLVFPLGGGCIGGWYFQGSDIESVVNHSYLNLGYAVAASTLTTFGNNCNDLLSSETVIMVKERFIESYGVPLFTIGTGGSGGAYQSNQTGDNYPGTFDGIVTTSSFPDVTTGMLPMGNSRLLDILFTQTRLGVFSVPQMKAISGYLSVGPVAGGIVPGMINHMSNVRGPRMDPRVSFPDQIAAGVGTDKRYVPAYASPPAVPNPYGARGDVYDHTVNVYGVILNTPFPGSAKFAQRPLDNVGLQYGLKALNDGVITVDQFLDVNEVIGGFDIDFNHVANRTVHYRDAAKRAYQGGRILNGGGGLRNMPVITRMGAGDLNANGDVHVRYHAQAIRQRLINANGNADNQAVYGNLAPMNMMIEQMDRWLTAVKADGSDRSLRAKVIANRPSDVVDACWKTGSNLPGDKISEPQTLAGDGRCNQLFPVGLSPEIVAGSPINVDIIKCQLKPIDMNDYKVAFTPAQRAKLAAIFPRKHGDDDDDD